MADPKHVQFGRGDKADVDFTNADKVSFVRDNNYTRSIYLGGEKYGEIVDGLNSQAFAFHIDGNNSDPEKRVSYLGQNRAYRPAKFNFETGEMELNDWKDKFFMPKPVALGFDGTVKGYLKENDYTQLQDGTAVSTLTNYNIMMEWPQIWLKIIPDNGDSTSAIIEIAASQLDSGFHCYNCYDKTNTLKKHFYTSVYDMSIDSNGYGRSITGVAPTNSNTADAQRTAALKCGAGWDLETFGDRQLITYLLWLISRSTDTQAAFGAGYGGVTSKGSSADALMASGTMNDKGMWFGDTAGDTGVKVFGMEHFWGNIWRRTVGIGDVNGTIKYKLTPGTIDGSTATDYNLTLDGYKTGGTLPASNIAYISQVTWNEDTYWPTAASGSDTTYYADGLWTYYNSPFDKYPSGNQSVALFGGNLDSGRFCGALAWILYGAASCASWDCGAALSFR